ncbi:MAG: hypothetical protein L6V95_06000 [Candidatus Melainabacteria bacterium]|nr:MAG: hypothetical protein L6V95_06000 [Candidatus Melainabacteria bacterium]
MPAQLGPKVVVLNDNQEFYNDYKNYFVKEEGFKSYYVLPSKLIKQMDITFDYTTGHMAKLKNVNQNNHYNEIIALANGVRKKSKMKKKQPFLIWEVVIPNGYVLLRENFVI